jgi:hypothetical protein
MLAYELPVAGTPWKSYQRVVTVLPRSGPWTNGISHLSHRACRWRDVTARKAATAGTSITMIVEPDRDELMKRGDHPVPACQSQIGALGAGDAHRTNLDRWTTTVHSLSGFDSAQSELQDPAGETRWYRILLCLFASLHRVSRFAPGLHAAIQRDRALKAHLSQGGCSQC